MKIIYVTIFISLLCTLCCCKNEGQYSPDEQKATSIPEIKDTLSAKKLQYSDLLPQWAFCTESYVVLIDRSDDAIIKVVDAHNDSLISAFGTIGRGRNELTHPCSDCYFDKNVKGELCMLVPTSQPCTYVVNMSASLAKGGVLLIPFTKKMECLYLRDYFILMVEKRMFSIKKCGLMEMPLM